MSVALKPSEVLDKAADLITPEGAWTQGSFARRADGEEAADERAPDACTWCVVGALWRAEPTGPRIARAKLARTLRVDAGAGLVDWNDAPNRTQSEVIAGLRKAAELARSEGS